jgi:hypothetical protein
MTLVAVTQWGRTARGTSPLTNASPAGQEGQRGPRAPLAGRRRRAARFLGGPLGETPGAPPVSRQLQSMAQQATRSPARGGDHVLHWMAGAFVRAASRQPRHSRAPGGEQVTAPQDAEPLDDPGQVLFCL